MVGREAGPARAAWCSSACSRGLDDPDLSKEAAAESLRKGDRVVVLGRLRQRSWETPEGERRSVAEIQADEVAASLKWATATIERVATGDDGQSTRFGSPEC